MNKELLDELSESMSLIRLAKTGLFKRMDIEGYELVSREVQLHRAVLDHALLDWFSDNEEVREDVENWLDIQNEDFQDACDRAVLDPVKVLLTFKAVKNILKGDNAKFKKVQK